MDIEQMEREAQRRVHGLRSITFPDARKVIEARIMLAMSERVTFNDWISWRNAHVYAARVGD